MTSTLKLGVSGPHGPALNADLKGEGEEGEVVVVPSVEQAPIRRASAASRVPARVERISPPSDEGSSGSKYARYI
jgi:hypothetical protein